MKKLITFFICLVLNIPLKAQCDFNFNWRNTGSNMTVLVTPGALSGPLVEGDSIGVFYLDNTGVEVCGGSYEWTGNMISISAFGDDATTPEKDGFSEGEEIVWKARSSSSTYELISTPSSTYTSNGQLIVSELFYTELPCGVVAVTGCMDETAENYNPEATQDDGSCVYPQLGACDLPEEYIGNTGANITVLLTADVVSGIVEAVAPESFYVVAKTSTGLVVGSSNDIVSGQMSIAVWGDNILTSEVDGATDGEAFELQIVAGTSLYDMEVTSAMLNFAPTTSLTYVTNGIASVSGVTISEGSCQITGCTDESADNYNPEATQDDNSCIYPLVSNCDLPGEYFGNTGANMTIMLATPFIDELDVVNEEAYIVAFSSISNLLVGSVKVGSEYIYNGQTALTFWGDDTLTPEIDGAMSDEPIYFQLVDGTLLYDLEFSGIMQNFAQVSQVTYVTSGIASSTGVVKTLRVCSPVLGCTDENAGNYNTEATDDDGSCIYLGCTNVEACNYDESAAQDDGSCLYPGCTNSNYIEYFTQDFEAGCDNGSCAINVKNYGLTAEHFQEPMFTGNNMAVGFDIDTLYGIQSAIIGAFYDLNGDGVINSESFVASNGEYYSECVGYTQYDPDGFFALALWGDDNTTPEIEGLQNGQSDVIFALLTEENQVIAFQLEPEFNSYITNGIVQTNGLNLDVTIYGCTDSTFCNYNSFAEVDDGSCEGSPGCLDHFYLEYNEFANCNNINLCLTTWEQAYFTALDSAALALEEVEALHEAELNDIEQELAYWSSPVEIDLLIGWNIIGYTFPEPQDVVACMQEINEIIVIVKNNAAQMYWPEFGFNGIGDFIPGQGYQIKVSEAYSGFTYPNTQGQRIELIESVPQWAIDMEVDLHPNDIRTLVKVVNMLGQEVNPENQLNGTTLLYLYNDGTVEKKILR
jgi:hypothetical protein